MIQLTRKVFSDLAICMIGFGVCMGVVFPFFVTFMGVPPLEHLIQQTGASGGAILVEADGDLSVVASHGIRSPEELKHSDHVRLAMRTEKRHKISVPEDIVLQSVLADFRPTEVLMIHCSTKAYP